MVLYRKVAVPSEINRDMDAFAGSVPQRVLHNALVVTIEARREALENSVVMEDILRLQGQIKTARELLTQLHAFDSSATKEIYV